MNVGKLLMLRDSVINSIPIINVLGKWDVTICPQGRVIYYLLAPLLGFKGRL